MGGEPVIPLSLARIARVTGGQLCHGDPDAVVSGEVVIDSRRAGPGGLFAAVAGERSDGHDFAAAAVAAGATAVLATRPVTVPSVLVTDVPAALAALARSVVEALPADGVAILNADDPRVLAMAERTEARVVTFSSAPASPGMSGAPVRAADICLDELGRPSFTLLTPEGSAPVTLRLHGAHNVPNALAAAALARELGMDLDGIADGLGAAVARSRWRMEVHRRADGVTIINDAYNANPESVRAAIDALAHLSSQGGRAFAV